MTPRRVKVLHLVNSLEAGGMENIVVEVCNGLAADHFQPSVCCLERLGAFALRLRENVGRLEIRKAPGFRMRDLLTLRQQFQSEHHDVVHTHHLGGLIFASLARGLSRRPRIIHSEHIILHDWELQPRRLWQRRFFYRFAHRVFTLTRQQHDQLLDLGLRHPRLFILPNGVDCERFTPVSSAERAALRTRLGLDPDALWFGKVARFATAKRHVMLIDAFEQAAPSCPRLHLLLVGDGGVEKDAVLSRVASSPFRERIHWAGLQNDPVPWYQALDALVIASESEGMPNAALEAMACGIPLVANTACGVEEVARPHLHGWIQPLPGVPELAQALSEAGSVSPAERAQRGAAARTHVQTTFSKSLMLDRYADLYSSATVS